MIQGYPSAADSSEAILAWRLSNWSHGTQTPLARLQIPLAFPQTPFAGPDTPLAGPQTSFYKTLYPTGSETPLDGP